MFGKRSLDFEYPKSEFEKELCTNDYHVITKMYALLLKFETEKGQVKESMVKWAENAGHDISMHQREKIHTKDEIYT